MGIKEQVMEIVKNLGMAKAIDIEASGISRNYLYTLTKAGILQKKVRGVYALPDYPVTEHYDIIEISKRVPNSVICLISALSFHNITTQIPHDIWITIPRGSWRPSIDYPPLNLTYVSGEAYSYGIREHEISGVRVKVYTPAKTVADCFKFRNKVGLDVAIEALKETWRSKQATMNELMNAAKVCKVSKIMRPYLEAIV